MWLHIVHAVRQLRRRPALAAVGIISLALGIGCTLACASVVNAVLFRAFPYHEPGRLVFVWEDNTKRGVGLTPTSVLNYQDFRTAATAFEELGAFASSAFTITGRDQSTRAMGYQITAGLLESTGVSPLIGRLFTRPEDRPGGPNVVVLSYGLWTRQFGADRAIVGQEIRLTGVPHTIIGVMPSGFLLPPIFSARLVGTDVLMKEADLWMPLRIDGRPQARAQRSLFMLGRLKAGHSLDVSQAEASTIARRLAGDHPAENVGMDLALVPLDRQVLTNVQRLLGLLLVASVLVLVIASVNAAHLLLVDSLKSGEERAVRWALGASNWRLAFGPIVQSLLWCALATLGALLVAEAFAVPVAAYTKANVPRLNEARLDAAVGAVAVVIGAALAMAMSLLPIQHARHAGSTRSQGATSAPVGMSRWRRLFVIVQLATAVIVLSTAMFLFRSAGKLADVNPGFAPDGVSVFELMLPDTRYGAPPQRIEFQRRLLEEVGDSPGRPAAVVDQLPFGGETAISNLTIESHVVADQTVAPRAPVRAISASYFRVLSIPAVAGRVFERQDGAEAASTAIVNEAFARRFLPGENIVGRRIKRGPINSLAPWLTVIGVVGSSRSAGLAIEPQPEVFVPYVKSGTASSVRLILKSAAPLREIASTMRQCIRRVDADLSPATVTDMSELVALAVGQPYFYARLFGVLAAMALFLSLGGLYSIVALAVSARSREIAIRCCLGAQRGDIVRLVLGEAAISVGIGIALGGLGAVAVQRRLAALVYGVESTDSVVTIAGSAVLLSALALVAVYVAIRRVPDARPMELLRNGAGALA